MLSCPVCGSALVREETTYRCGEGHCFDRSRDGYVNLLLRPPRHRASGDSAEMIVARRRFLDSGGYAPLRDAVLELLGPGPVLDLGCGEGYYSRSLDPGSPVGEVTVVGVDLSRPAVRLASRRAPGIAYAVANAFDLPVLPATVGSVMSVFGPVAPEEIDRVLSPRGAVVVAAPGPDHLVELKSAFLAEARPHQSEPPLVGDGRFRATASRRVRVGLQLDAAEVTDLWDMTPYRWQVPAGRQVAPEAMSVTGDFLVTRLERS